MSQKIFVPEFWPLWTTPGKLRRFDYRAIDGSMPPITSVFSYDVGTNSMLLTDYNAHLQFQDVWYYQYRPNFGIAEWRDDYPGGKKVVMDGAFGTPIGWGEWQEIGGSYVNYPKMNPLQSWPPAAAKGVQCVAYEAMLPYFKLDNGKTYNDVLQFTYLQAWDGKPGGGARYWNAKGVGPIAVQWIAQDPSDPLGKPLIQTARMDAVVTDVDPMVA